jgi:hypothetical protein
MLEAGLATHQSRRGASQLQVLVSVQCYSKTPSYADHSSMLMQPEQMRDRYTAHMQRLLSASVQQT